MTPRALPGPILMPDPAHDAERAAFVNLLLDASAGTFRLFSAYIGHKLGYYRALAEGPLDARALAERTRTDARYAREWLEQQTVAGFLRVEASSEDGDKRRYRLPSGHAEALVDAESLDYLAPLVQLAVGATRPLAAVLDAYRTGGGVPYADYGEDLVEGQAGMNRAMFLKLMGTEWLPNVPDVHARLRADPPARVADFGCGAAWSSIGIARAYPNARVDGLDLDEASVDLARRNVKEAGLEDRVSVDVADAAAPELKGKYDLVVAFECIHDMNRPVEALRAMRGLAARDGAVVVVDERVGDAFTPGGVDLEWMMYGWSVLHCLPVGMADKPSAGTGTVLRLPTLERYAKEAGFASVEVLPVENPFFRFYRLRA